MYRVHGKCGTSTVLQNTHASQSLGQNVQMTGKAGIAGG